ncbi:MAG: hypothetical protein IJS73_03455 [Paludibacteraceae bacterium]|nr:hypothetical protein [Paludibacteraceae bacterium]
MKKFLFFLALPFLLVSCVKTEDVPTSEYARIQNGEPIKPMRISKTMSDFYLTDYVPTLSDTVVLFDGKPVFLNNGRAELPHKPASLTIMQISGGNTTISIPVIPDLPHRQGLFTTDCTRTSISFAFQEQPKEVKILAFLQNKLLPENLLSSKDGVYTLKLPKEQLNGRNFVRVYAVADGYNYNDLLIPLEDMKPVTDTDKLNRHDNEAQVLYSLMLDRFENGNQQNDKPLNSVEVLPIVDYFGGDIKGLENKINEGFFDSLGVTTIWVSPITQNPYDAWGYYTFPSPKDCKYLDRNGNAPQFTKFSGYHGYWPIYATKVDERFGTDEELHQMLSSAHAHDLNVVLDYVANHMHINSPTLQEHPDWVTDSILPDGRLNFELWDEQRLTTWFDRHIPTLDLERPEVYQPMTDSALYWLENFEFDGFRHDACKHIPECYWRTFTQKMKTRFPNRHLWMIGETYGSPELIGSYVKSGMLDAQFDFNVYYTIVDAFLKPNGDLRNLARVLEESMAAYGAHHTMGNISGNHDNARFISLAGGALSPDEDAKAAGWSRQVGVGNAEVAYKKAMLLQVLNFTIPGVPCIYQGDEYAEPGGNDPDNRKPLRYERLTDKEKDFRQEVGSLSLMRRSSMPLLYGDYRLVEATEDVLCFERIYMGKKVVVAINKSLQQKTLSTGETLEGLSYKISEL